MKFSNFIEKMNWAELKDKEEKQKKQNIDLYKNLTKTMTVYTIWNKNLKITAFDQNSGLPFLRNEFYEIESKDLRLTSVTLVGFKMFTSK